MGGRTDLQAQLDSAAAELGASGGHRDGEIENSTYENPGHLDHSNLQFIGQEVPRPCGADLGAGYNLLYKNIQPADVTSLHQDIKTAAPPSEGLAAADGGYSLLYGGDGEGKMGTMHFKFGGQNVDLPHNNSETADQFEDHIYGVLEDDDSSSST